MNSTRRAAGLGMVTYGIGTSLAFMAIGSPGGDYSDADVTRFVSSGHWALAITLAYVGAFASLGLLAFGNHMRRQLTSSGDVLWGLLVAGTSTAVVGWFLVGGVAVAFAEGGTNLATVPHPVVYMASEMSNLIAVCASAFFVGAAALVLAARAGLPRGLRVVTYVAGGCGLLAAFWFPIFLFWLWAIAIGIWTLASKTHDVESRRDDVPAPLPVG